MKLFGSKDNSYGNEIEQLCSNQKELAKIVDKTNSDIIAMGLDFTKYKESMDIDLGNVWDNIKKLNTYIAEFENWKKQYEQEKKVAEEAKIQLPNTLTYGDICKTLHGFTCLNTTGFKYYLYECKLLDMKINRIHNTFRISKDINEVDSEIKKYIHITDGVMMFDHEVIDFLLQDRESLQGSLDRYVRRQKQFTESKQHLSETEIKNYQIEIGNLCGVDRGNDKKYNSNKWGTIYKRYGQDHKDWVKKYEVWKKKFLQEHPNYKYDKPSKVMYLVQEVGDGDVLLKIACELFVN